MMLAALLLAGATVVVPNDYHQPANWLCRPGGADACSAEMPVTTVTAKGKVIAGKLPPKARPAADCFYVYPTASLDPTPNSDMVPGPEERGMAASQLAAFGGVCRLFAPMYRQVTLTALRTMMAGKPGGEDRELPYADVLAAWRDYLARDNKGRPFVLIGHSQGSMLLKRLVAEEIDGKPVQAQMLSAILPGTSVAVAEGKDVGGDLKTVPLCRAASQTGCVITWASYRDTAPPPANALFGKAAGGMVAGCTNPAAPGGGAAPLDAILGFPWWRGGVAQYQRPKSDWSAGGKPLATDFVRMPGLLSGECRRAGGVSYLSVHVQPGAATVLAEAVAGTATVGDTAYPDWGWHVVDMAIVQGDLVRLVRSQTQAWMRR
jgi:hypothetical protein